MIGSAIQDSLIDITLRFRTHAFVFTVDIAKMYRMKRIHGDHTKYLHVFWRPDIAEQLRTLEFLTVTYGTASAPYLATHTLKQLAHDKGYDYPRAADILGNDFYIDDALSARTELEELFRKGGFELHKKCSNSTEFLDTIPEERKEKRVSHELKAVNDMIKTVGIFWNPSSDQSLFHEASTDQTRLISKRYIFFKKNAKYFDPLSLQALPRNLLCDSCEG